MTLESIIDSEIRKRVDGGLFILGTVFFLFTCLLLLAIPTIFGTLENYGFAAPLDSKLMFLWNNLGYLVGALLVWLLLNVVQDIGDLIDSWQKENPVKHLFFWLTGRCPKCGGEMNYQNVCSHGWGGEYCQNVLVGTCDNDNRRQFFVRDPETEEDN